MEVAREAKAYVWSQTGVPQGRQEKNGSGVTLKEKYMKTVVGAKTASDRME